MVHIYFILFVIGLNLKISLKIPNLLKEGIENEISFSGFGSFFQKAEAPKTVTSRLESNDFDEAVVRATRKFEEKLELEKLLVRRFTDLSVDQYGLFSVTNIRYQTSNNDFCKI